jgi:hypothetical protein
MARSETKAMLILSHKNGVDVNPILSGGTSSGATLPLHVPDSGK